MLDCGFGSLDAGGCSFGCASVVRVVVWVGGRCLLGLAGMVGLISGWFDGCLWVGGWRLAAALVLVDCCERVLLGFSVWWFWLSGCWVVVVLVGLVRFWVSWWFAAICGVILRLPSLGTFAGGVVCVSWWLVVGLVFWSLGWCGVFGFGGGCGFLMRCGFGVF